MNNLETVLQEIPDLKEHIQSKNVYIWGIGNTALMYQEGFKREKDLNIFGYAVNDEAKWGDYFCNKKIYGPKEVADDDNALVLICSLQPWVYEEVSIQLNTLQIENYYVDKVIFGLHKDEIRKVWNSLYDNRSKEIYAGLIKHRIKCQYPGEKYASFDSNFVSPEYKMINEKEVFVDCGAFVGDSIERYIWYHYGSFGKIYGFEPDKNNFEAMCCRVDRLKREWNLRDDAIELLPYGISDKSFLAYVHKNTTDGLSSSVLESKDDNSEECQIVSIDDFFLDNKREYSFLKADVEGHEYKLLGGAQESIRNYSPRLAICMYHNATDFCSIPLKIKELNKDYKLIIRHHSVQFFDTVVYAWV